MKEILEQILESQKQTNQHLLQVDQRLDKIEVQQDENTQILKSLEHASQVHKADMDHLTHKVMQLEGAVNNIKEDVLTIEILTSKNWNDIANLKAIR